MDKIKKDARSNFIAKYATVFTLLLLFLVFALTTEENRFIQIDNLMNILRQVATLCVVALGVTFAMAAGEFDMSTGPIVGFACVLSVGLITEQGLNPAFALLGVVLLGLLAGTINAFVTTSLKIPSIIVTLASQSIFSGFIYMYSGGKALYGQGLPEFYKTIGRGSWLGIPILVFVMVIFIAITYFLLNKTLMGRYIYATGGNAVTARLSGISTRKYTYIGLTLSSVFAAIAGFLLATRLGTGQPTAGDSYTMEAVSAVFIGMTTIRVGRANVLGTLVGVFLLGIVSNGLNLWGWEYFMQDIAKGVIMIAAVAFAASKTELKFFK